jgi:3-dehydroquinate synthase
MQSVVLTGFMGTGKTAVGREVAQRLGWRFVDTDDLVVEAAGMDVAAIFARFGEAHFRALERQAIDRACATPGAVIATGGGAMLDPANRTTFSAAGPVICLEADVDVIVDRVGTDARRPLLAGANVRERVRALRAERAPAYAAADHHLDTSGRSVAEVADAVLGILRAGAQGGLPETVETMATMAADDDVVRVDLGARSYAISVGARILGTLGERLRALDVGSRVALVTTTTVARLYGAEVRRGIEAAGFAVTTIEIPDGEEHKTLATLAGMYDRLIAARLDRRSTLVALGGGVVGDLGGFAAATFLRGIALVQVPTTLVAQVDASIGGKTAVNHPLGKNLIGAFYQPRMVLADVEVLRSLPRRELLAGLAEVIKYGASLDAELFDFVEAELPRVLALEAAAIARVVVACCRLKAAVVGADETEGGYRAVLNFGHTVGHAVEALGGYRRHLHGEAVAIGLAYAARLSADRGYCDATSAARVVRLLERAGLPTAVPADIDATVLAARVAMDKKTREDAVRFVCLETIGRTRFEYLTGVEIARHLGR